MELYNNQVRLLLDVIPIVAEEQIYAMHGGTAINLFVRDMPRLSVDIDLTYVKIQPRDETIANIADTLERIKSRIESTVFAASVQHQKEKI